MEIIISEIIEKFKPFFLIMDRKSEIILISNELKEILKKDKSLNLETELKKSKKNCKISIGGNTYTVDRLQLDGYSNSILVLDELGDFYDYETKAYCLEEIIKNLYDGVLLSDKNGKVVIYNDSMGEIEARESEDMLGKYIWDAYGYSDINKSEHMQVFNSKVPIINKYKAHVYKDGRPLYKSYSTFPIEKGQETIGVYSISKNETKIHNLLSETIELKRQFKDKNKDKKVKSNGTRYTFTDIIGSSDTMTELIREAQGISWLDNNILIVGDTGTGKEVFAQSIHNFGKRKSEPFIGINCSAIPENLLESILFGTVKGAYTGALDSSGLFEEAGGGTLFLDEINSMPMSMQTKLLRVLQERQVRRVGGKESYPIECRIISAMNEDPNLLMEEERLRKDLFYRIAGFNLYIPPLKDRKEDLFEMTYHFITKNNINMNRNIMEIKDNLKEIMESYEWPGNARELEHFIENIMIKSHEDDRYLRAENIPNFIKHTMGKTIPNNKKIEDISLEEELERLERDLIIKALDKNLWNVSKSAKDLKVTRQSLIYRMKKLDINR